mmetsp:Transcript_18076/g.30171  ORF Transcript_18076/g.30171 Transcript_18076/m.30171 type:complete len:217 (+) Transcript_18076:418-1068(+)
MEACLASLCLHLHKLHSPRRVQYRRRHLLKAPSNQYQHLLNHNSLHLRSRMGRHLPTQPFSPMQMSLPRLRLRRLHPHGLRRRHLRRNRLDHHRLDRRHLPRRHLHRHSRDRYRRDRHHLGHHRQDHHCLDRHCLDHRCLDRRLRAHLFSPMRKFRRRRRHHHHHRQRPLRHQARLPLYLRLPRKRRNPTRPLRCWSANIITTKSLASPTPQQTMN